MLDFWKMEVRHKHANNKLTYQEELQMLLFAPTDRQTNSCNTQIWMHCWRIEIARPWNTKRETKYQSKGRECFFSHQLSVLILFPTWSWIPLRPFREKWELLTEETRKNKWLQDVSFLFLFNTIFWFTVLAWNFQKIAAQRISMIPLSSSRRKMSGSATSWADKEHDHRCKGLIIQACRTA